MALTANDITAQNFRDFYQQIFPYLGSYDKGKLTFVGEVKAFFAETAPNGFLVCDGTTYDKADYPELANLLLSLTDHSAYEVSGDNTKFKVPDLRGEFLRGSGTNSHTNQGSGAGVGVHQDGTSIPNIYATTNNGYIQVTTDGTTTATAKNVDSEVSGNIIISSFNTNPSSKEHGAYTSRPTNTSVLFCIAYKDTMVDLDFLSYGGERFAKSDMYDTNERVIGKWIDGKPLYQKTIQSTLPTTTTGTVTSKTIDFSQNVDIAWVVSGFFIFKNGRNSLPLYANVDGTGRVRSQINTEHKLSVDSNLSVFNDCPVFVVVRYTKTTDTADSFKYSTPTDYSTEEKIVGTWIDGKPLYQKTIDFGVLPNATTKNVAHGITNISQMVDIKTIIFTSSSAQSTNSAAIQIGTTNGASFYREGGNIVCTANIDLSTFNCYVTLQYTKTTD